jgi:ribosomal protein L7/L12
VTFVIIGLGLVVMLTGAIALFGQLRVSAARRSGLLPAAGQSTLADVERLASLGEKVWAIRCYREIHSCGLAEVKRAVERLHPVA